MNFLRTQQAGAAGPQELAIAVPFKPFLDLCLHDKLMDKDDLIRDINTLNYLYLNGWSAETENAEDITRGLLDDIFGHDAEDVSVQELLLVAHRLRGFAADFLQRANYHIPEWHVGGVNYEDQGLAMDIDNFSIVVREGNYGK